MFHSSWLSLFFIFTVLCLQSWPLPKLNYPWPTTIHKHQTHTQTHTNTLLHLYYLVFYFWSVEFRYSSKKLNHNIFSCFTSTFCKSPRYVNCLPVHSCASTLSRNSTLDLSLVIFHLVWCIPLITDISASALTSCRLPLMLQHHQFFVCVMLFNTAAPGPPSHHWFPDVRERSDFMPGSAFCHLASGPTFAALALIFKAPVLWKF